MKIAHNRALRQFPVDSVARDCRQSLMALSHFTRRTFMNVRKFCVLALVLAFCTTGIKAAGLYDDEKKITSGDIKDLDYWHAKFYHMMMEAALKSHQAEYQIGLMIGGQMNSTMPDLIKKYPKHEELKKWMEEYESISKKIDKNADRLALWKPDFEYWTNEAYRQAWVNMNLGKMDVDAKDWRDAYARYRWARENFDKMLDHEEWMKNWPEDVIKWVKETKVEAEKMEAEMKKKA
jgi:hypothetical protein